MLRVFLAHTPEMFEGYYGARALAALRDHAEVVRNPNYRGEPYPCEGMPEDEKAGLLADCGKKTPFVDRIVATARSPISSSTG